MEDTSFLRVSCANVFNADVFISFLIQHDVLILFDEAEELLA